MHKQDGRRLSLSDPEKSLLLLKPTFQVKHGGGKRFPKDSPDYVTLLNWIRNGANSVPEQERRMVALSVNPPSNILLGKESKRRLLVTARYSDGSESDVTQLMRFQSNDDLIASVDPQGTMTGLEGGETAIVVRGPGVTGVAIGPLGRPDDDGASDLCVSSPWTGVSAVPRSEPRGRGRARQAANGSGPALSPVG